MGVDDGDDDNDDKRGTRSSYINIKCTLYASFFTSQIMLQKPHEDTLIHGILT
jgi:hypothetical protein